MTQRRDLIVITIDGNIASGKSSIMRGLQEIHPEYEYIYEPLKLWKNYRGMNMLEEMYKDPKKNVGMFQHFALQTMAENINESIASTDKRVIIIERSIWTTFTLFTRIHHFQLNNIDTFQYNIIRHLYAKLVKEQDKIFKTEECIYLDCSPSVCMDRINKREKTHKIEQTYLNLLDDYGKKSFVGNDIYDFNPKSKNVINTEKSLNDTIIELSIRINHIIKNKK